MENNMTAIEAPTTTCDHTDCSLNRNDVTVCRCSAVQYFDLETCELYWVLDGVREAP